MEEFVIPRKLIQTKATLTVTSKILILGVPPDPFETATGIRQGDGLSTVLFNLALEKVIRAMSINWKGTTSKQLTVFADYADLIGRGTLAVKQSFVDMQTTGKEVELLVYKNKTKYLTLDRQHRSRIGQNIIGQNMIKFNFEVVQSFKYLGSVVNITNNIEEFVFKTNQDITRK